MPLQPGERLGSFEIVAFIGAGGMGEVYRARDTRLGRAVAIKILSAEIATDPQLRERFEREAQTISTLNHPSICTLHDVGRHENVDYLVMEFLEGETLADRLARGPLTLKEALTIAAQVGEGLEAAHRQGIVHRDLKPGNIMLVKADGAARSQAKLLDFGLAKLRGGVADNTPVVVSAARTDVGNLTAVGAVLGTLQYMSPEQLAGREADARADIFALGAVLYETVTGRKAFEGKSQVSLMAAILEQDPPPISSLQPIAPRPLDHLVRGCLAKEPSERWQNATDVVKQIRWIADELATTTDDQRIHRAPARRERALWVTALIALAIALGALVVRQRFAAAPPAATVRFEIAPPPGGAFPGANSTPRLAVSPDGQYVAFTVTLRDGMPDQLWIRRLDSLQAKPLVTVGETIVEPVQQPFWSPDSRQVAFFVDGKLKKADVAGGVVQTLCSVPGSNFGGTWNADGTILFGSTLTAGLRRVSAAGGVPTQVTQLDASSKEAVHLWPRFLPDGRHFLYQAQASSGFSRTIYVGTLDGPDRTRLFASQFMVDFAPPDRLLFLRDGALLAQRFDPVALQLHGEPIALAEGVQASPANGRAGFSVSTTGVLVYRPGESATGADSQLAMIDRTGREVGVVGAPSSYRGIELSPDGTRAVVHKEEANASGDLWVIDLVRGSTSRLTFDPENHNLAPVWSPDGRRIVFAKNRGGSGALYDKDSSGVGEERLLYQSKSDLVVPWSVSPDGATLVFSQRNQDTNHDLYTLPLTGNAQPSLYLRAPGLQVYGQFSRNGRWLAYTSSESGNLEVYVQSFPRPDSRYQVSTNGGLMPRWGHDDRELFFRLSGGGGPTAIMAADVDPVGSSLRFGIPQKLFQTTSALGHAAPVFTYAVAADGQRVLAVRGAADGGGSAPEVPLAVVVNWDAAFDR